MVQTRSRKRLCTGFEHPNADSRPSVVQDLKKSPFLRLSVELHMEIFEQLDNIDDIGNLAKTSKHVWAVFQRSIGLIVMKFFLPVELEFLNIQRPNFIPHWHANELRRRGKVQIRKPRSGETKSKKKENPDECEYQQNSNFFTFFPVEQATGTIVDRRLCENPKVYRLEELRRLLANRKLVDSWMYSGDRDDNFVFMNQRGFMYTFQVETDPAKTIDGIPPELQLQFKSPTPVLDPDGPAPVIMPRQRIEMPTATETEINRFRHGGFNLALYASRCIAFYTRRTIAKGARSYVAVNNPAAALEIPFRDLLSIVGVLHSMSRYRYTNDIDTGIWYKGFVEGSVQAAYLFAIKRFGRGENRRNAWDELHYQCLWDGVAKVIEPALKIIENAPLEAPWRQPLLGPHMSIEEICLLIKQYKETIRIAPYSYGGYYGYAVQLDDLRNADEIIFLNNFSEIHLRPSSGPIGVRIGGRNEEYCRPAVARKPFLQIHAAKCMASKHVIMPSYEDEN